MGRMQVYQSAGLQLGGSRFLARTPAMPLLRAFGERIESPSHCATLTRLAGVLYTRRDEVHLSQQHRHLVLLVRLRPILLPFLFADSCFLSAQTRASSKKRNIDTRRTRPTPHVFRPPSSGNMGHMG